MSDKQELWGGETKKAIGNFPVSGEPIPTHVARWLGAIKGAAATVNSPTRWRRRPSSSTRSSSRAAPT